MTERRQRIVILGGGSGGVSAAANLGHALRGAHEITLVDRQSFHVYQPDYLWLMLGQREPWQFTRPLSRLERFGVRFLQRSVERIDPERQIVLTDGGELPYDHLIVSLGLQTHPELLPGDADEAHHVWELAAAERFRDALRRFTGGRIVIGVAGPPYRCPPAPYETLWLLDAHFRQRGLRDLVSFDVFSSEAGPLGGGSEAARWIQEQSEARGARMHFNFEIERIDGERRRVLARDGRTLPYDLLMVVPPHRPPQPLLDSGMIEGFGVPVNLDDLSTPWANIYAVGDCANVPASRAGVVAHQAADLVAHNLAVQLTGHGQKRRFVLQTT